MNFINFLHLHKLYLNIIKFFSFQYKICLAVFRTFMDLFRIDSFGFQKDKYSGKYKLMFNSEEENPQYNIDDFMLFIKAFQSQLNIAS